MGIEGCWKAYGRVTESVLVTQEGMLGGTMKRPDNHPTAS